MTDYRPFLLRRTEGGDSVRPADGTGVWLPALRYGPRVVLPEEVLGTGLLTRPVGYDGAEITVQVPETVDWSQAVLVRGGFGFPTTAQDGVQIWYTNTRPTDIDTDTGLPIDLSQRVMDTPLTTDRPMRPNQTAPPGNWFYYSLFLWIGGQWVLSAHNDVLVPQNYHHSETLFGLIPPFYQKADDEYAVDGRNGTLRLFSSVLGYDLDYTRTLCDGVLNLYSVDRVPARLLRFVGDNLGFPYEETLGAARYRSIIEQLDDLNHMRGTPVGLANLVTAATDYRCDVAVGKNLMLTVDDSEFVGGGPYYPTDPEYASTGVGLWGNMGVVSLADALVAPDAVNHPATTSSPRFVKGADPTVSPPDGRGYLLVESIATADIVLSLGVHDATTEPVYKGVPVEPGALYDFQAQVRRTSSVPVSDVWLGVYWFGETGTLASYIGYDIGPNTPDSSDSSSAWLHLDMQPQPFAPSVAQGDAADAYYAVPFVWWHTTTPTAQAWPAQGHLLASVMFSKVSVEGAAIAPVNPDVFLTLGVTAKKLGSPTYFLGTSEERT